MYLLSQPEIADLADPNANQPIDEPLGGVNFLNNRHRSVFSTFIVFMIIQYELFMILYKMSYL